MNTFIYNKKNLLLTGILTVAILAAVCFAVFSKSSAEENIASHTDNFILLSHEKDVLQQSWQANAKNITGLRLNISQENCQNLTGKVYLSMWDGEAGEVKLCEAVAEIGEGQEEIIFSLQETKLELGKRYFFRIELAEVSRDTVLAIAINSNYGGMQINQEEVSGALGGAVIYEKTGNLAWLLRICLMFTSISFLLMLLFNRRFEEVFGLAFGVVFLYIYIWGIFEMLEFGVQTLFIFSMIFAVCIPVLMGYKHRRWSELVSPGMVAFWALFFLYFMLDRNVLAGKVDDLNHWQLCVRDMWYFDSYPFHPGSTLIAMRYTPGFATIEYLFLYLYGGYREGIILLSCHTIGFAMLSIFYTRIPWKQFHKALPLTVLIAGFPLLVYQSHYGILYVDAYLGIIGAYLLICYFTEESNLFNVIRITAGSILLIMTKEMGLAIAFTIYLIIFIDLYLKNHKIKPFIQNSFTKKYFFSGCISLLSFVSWQLYILIVGAKYGIHNSFNFIWKMFDIAKFSQPIVENEIQLASAAETGAFYSALDQATRLANTASDAGPRETIIEMIQWILGEKTFIGGSYAELTLLVILLCAALGFAGLYKKLQIPMKQIIVSLLIGTAIYTIFLVICYIFLFQEPSAIPAARRYMGSYLLLFLITIVGILIVKGNQFEEQGNWKQLFVWIISVFVLMQVPENHPYYTTEENFGLYFTTWKNYQTIGEVFRSFADKDERIFYVEYSDSELVPQYNYLTFFNSVVPNLTQGLFRGRKPVVSENAPYLEYTIHCSTEQWQQILEQDYDYVYLRFVGDYFKDNYGSIFEDYEQIENGAIYKVLIDEAGETKLKKIAFKDLN